MTAGYRKSDFQKALEERIAAIDTGAPAFLDAAPFVLDCREDVSGLRAQVPLAQQARLEARRPATVSALPPAVRDYAIAKLRAGFEAIDDDCRAKVRAILRHWRAGRASGAGEGIDILLPGGMRVAYDASDLIGFA